MPEFFTDSTGADIRLRPRGSAPTALRDGDGWANSTGQPFFRVSGSSLEVAFIEDLGTAAFLDESAIDHGSIAGLADDDHSQYHTDARALTWLGTRSTTDLPEGGNLYYTDARADARIALATLDDLGDVAAYSALASGELLQWDGAQWLHRTLAEAGVSAVGHTHAAADVTSGQFANARISSSSVTQHQGAIDHGSIAGLADDDHTQYALVSGARAFTGDVIVSHDDAGVIMRTQTVDTFAAHVDLLSTSDGNAASFGAANTNGFRMVHDDSFGSQTWVLRGCAGTTITDLAEVRLSDRRWDFNIGEVRFFRGSSLATIKLGVNDNDHWSFQSTTSSDKLRIGYDPDGFGEDWWMEIHGGGNVTLSNSDASSGPGTGAFQVAGGIYADANSYFGGDVIIGGNDYIVTGTNDGLVAQAGNTGTNINFDFADVSTADAVVRMFRNTNTSGGRKLQTFKGDGTATLTFQVDAATGRINVIGDSNYYMDYFPSTTDPLINFDSNDYLRYRRSDNVLTAPSTLKLELNNTSASTGAGTGAMQVAGGIYAGAESYFAGTATLGGSTGSLGLKTTSGGAEVGRNTLSFLDMKVPSGGASTDRWRFAWDGQDIVMSNIDGTVGQVIIEGIYSNTTASAASISINSSNVLQRSTSSRRAKRNIRSLRAAGNGQRSGEDIVDLLRPVRFRSSIEADGDGDFLGLIAEEVAEVAPELVTYDAEGIADAVLYPHVVAPLIAAVQDLRDRVAALEGGGPGPQGKAAA